MYHLPVKMAVLLKLLHGRLNQTNLTLLIYQVWEVGCLGSTGAGSR